MDNIELKMGKLFDSYNLRFEARDATAYNKGRNMIIFCLKPEVSVSPVYEMRRNTVTDWKIANRETRSFVRLNTAFRKTLLQAAKTNSRKLKNHREQLLSRALISSRIVLSHEHENYGK